MRPRPNRGPRRRTAARGEGRSAAAGWQGGRLRRRRRGVGVVVGVKIMIFGGDGVVRRRRRRPGSKRVAAVRPGPGRVHPDFLGVDKLGNNLE